MNSFEQNTNVALDWGYDRGILQGNFAMKRDGQAYKFMEEALETFGAIQKERLYAHLGDIPDEALLQVKDGIGDVLVTLTMLAEMYGWTLNECLSHSLEIILKRDGASKAFEKQTL